VEPRIILVPRPLQALGLPRRFALVPDNGEAQFYPGGMRFKTQLYAQHCNARGLVNPDHPQFDRKMQAIDLGSGLVTNVGVLALANDFAWSATNALNSLFAKMKYQASGTGVTAAAATDIKLQTASGNGGQTPVVATQTLISAANLQKFQAVGLIAYTGGEAVTEWGQFCYDSTLPTVTNLSDATGSPFTAGSATTGTVTGTPLTASSATVMGQQMSIFERTSGTNLSWGLVTGNTTSIITVPAWYLVASGLAGQAPANTETYVIRPIMWDHKVFAAINVVNGDSIQYTYQLTIQSGG
jgi:hypothetical protein